MDKPSKKKIKKPAGPDGLCLEFCNTAGLRSSEDMSEYMPDYQALVDWSLRMGVLSGPRAKSLLDWSRKHPAKAGAIHARAQKLREAVFGIFSALDAGEAAAQADLEILNQELAGALGNLRVRPTPEGFAYTWPQDGGSPDGMLWPVARSAAELLVSEDHLRVKRCASDTCDWLFFDTSKNRSRRWCDMKQCGNREKARRHYKKRSGAGKGKSG